MKDTYFDEWDENSNIAWWNAGRKKLNVVIRLVNQWTIDECPADESARLLRHIDMGLQTFASDEESSDWGDVLRRMRDYINEKTS